MISSKYFSAQINKGNERYERKTEKRGNFEVLLAPSLLPPFLGLRERTENCIAAVAVVVVLPAAAAARVDPTLLSEHRFLERLSSTVRLIEGKGGKKKVGRFKLSLSEIGHRHRNRR